jgi:hypothetical protein
MKTTLHKLLSMAVLGVTLQLQSLPAWAGLADNQQPVYRILHMEGYIIGASGTMTGARYSADNTQFIGCDIHSGSKGISCRAKDKTGKYVYCESSDPKFIAAVNAMTDSSYIKFYFARGTSQCSELIVNNSSRNLR